MPLDHLAPVAKGACVSGLHRTIKVRKTVLGRLLHPRHYTNSKQKHTLGTKRYRLQLYHTLITEVLSGNVSREAPSVCPPLGCNTDHWYFPEMSLQTPLKPWFFNCGPEDTSRTAGLEVSRVYDYSPSVLYIFAYFKSLASNWPETRYWLRSFPLEHWQVLAHPHQLGPVENKSAYSDNHKGLRNNQELEQGWTIGSSRFIIYTRPLLQD